MQADLFCLATTLLFKFLPTDRREPEGGGNMEIPVERDKLYEILRLLREARSVPFFRSNRNLLVKASENVLEILEQSHGVDLPYLSSEVIREMIMSGKDIEWLRQEAKTHIERTNMINKPIPPNDVLDPKYDGWLIKRIFSTMTTDLLYVVAPDEKSNHRDPVSNEPITLAGNQLSRLKAAFDWQEYDELKDKLRKLEEKLGLHPSQNWSNRDGVDTDKGKVG